MEKLFWRSCYIFIFTLLAILSAYEIGYTINNVVSIWPAAAVTYWAIRRYGLSGFIGTVLASYIHSIAWLGLPLFNFFIPIIGSLSAWAAVLVERHLNPRGDIFASSRSMLVFLTVGIGLFSLSFAIIGNTVVTLQFGIPWSVYGIGVWNWFLGDYTGCIMLAPLLLMLQLSYKQIIIEWRSALTELALSLLLLSIIFLVISSGIMKNYGDFSPMFLALPGAIFLSSRAASARICLCFFLFMISALMMTTIIGGNNEDNIALRTVQLYLTIVLICALILHSMRIERYDLIDKLANEREQLEMRVKERTAELAQQVLEKEDIVLQMEVLSRTDPLTGLYNRRYLGELASHDFKRCQRNNEQVSLCMLDIDFFKKVNDMHGHITGDSVLKEVAQILLTETRKNIDRVVRLGGEEFAILMPQTSLKLAKKVSERIRHKVATHHFKIGGVDSINVDFLTVTISIGVVQCSTMQSTIYTAIDSADKALYKAKHQGRNRVICDELSYIA